MKKIICLMLLTFSFNAFTGQEGSGGNICPVLQPNGSVQYHVLEELLYPELLNPNFPAIFSPLKKSDSAYSYEDLILTPAGNIAKELISSLNSEYVYRDVIQGHFSRLGSVAVVSDYFARSFAGSFRKIPGCNPQDATAAIVTWSDGLVMLSRPAWDSLHLEGQVILLIHETVRFAQTWSPRLSTLSEDEIQKLVMQIYSRQL